MSDSNLFIAGRPGMGVVLVRTEPQQVVHITHEQITNMKSSNGRNPYDMLSKAGATIISDLAKSGEDGGDAFAFAAGLSKSNLRSAKTFTMPLDAGELLEFDENVVTSTNK